MTKNLGSVDRIFRTILGIVLLGAPFISGFAMFSSNTFTAISVIAGIIMLATASIRFCPLYRIFGLRTCKL